MTIISHDLSITPESLRKIRSKLPEPFHSFRPGQAVTVDEAANMHRVAQRKGLEKPLARIEALVQRSFITQALEDRTEGVKALLKNQVPVISKGSMLPPLRLVSPADAMIILDVIEARRRVTSYRPPRIN